MSRRIADLVLRFPRTILVVGLLLTLAAGAGLLRIEISNDLRETIPHDNPVRIALDRLEDLFGSSETVVATIRHPSKASFTPEVLSDVMRVSTRLKRTRGVARVQSLATADKFERNEEGSLEVTKILESAPETATVAASVRAKVLDDPDLRDAFVADDEGSLAIYLDPKPTVSDAELVEGIRRVLEKVLPGYEVHLTGMPPVRSATDRTIKRDLLLLIPVVAVVLTLILALALRLVSGVVFTLLLIFLSILPAAGVMGVAGIPLSAQTNMFPILILAIACADSIHILTTYYQRLRGPHEKRSAVHSVVSELGLPVFLTSITSAAAFLSLLGSPIPPMAGLGVVVAVGIMWAWLLSIFVLPAVLLLMPEPTPPRLRRIGLQGPLDRIVRITHDHSGWTFSVTFLLIAAIGGIGIPTLEREVSPEKMFAAGSAVRTDASAIDDAFQSGSPMEVLVEADVKDPEVLSKVYAFSRAVTGIPQVGSVDGIASVVARITDSLTGTREIPDDRTRVAQALLLYSISGSPDRYQRLVATRGDALRVTVRLPNLPPAELEKVVADVDELVERELEGLDVTYTGKALLMLELSRLVVRSALVSISFSLLLVFAICAITFRNLWEGIEGMAPLLVAIVIVYGLMGFVGVPLTVATALISSIVIGVGVDYGVHVLARFDLLPQLGLRERVEETVHEVGRPILFNAFAVASGLAVLALSRFEPIRQLGLMAVMAMAAAALGALVLIPTMKTIRRKERG